jgi:hypothetical protein
LAEGNAESLAGPGHSESAQAREDSVVTIGFC